VYGAMRYRAEPYGTARIRPIRTHVKYCRVHITDGTARIRTRDSPQILNMTLSWILRTVA